MSPGPWQLAAVFSKAPSAAMALLLPAGQEVIILKPMALLSRKVCLRNEVLNSVGDEERALSWHLQRWGPGGGPSKGGNQEASPAG